MESLLNDWNSSTEDRAVAVQKWNQSIEQDYKDGKISAEAVIAGILPVPEKIKPPTPRMGKVVEGLVGVVNVK